mmetsp:Transcript_6883/g.14689  ORF Transcript_6883/g.14689 Transcript_6883/m.14689 type:complete len:435 (-) Transcript_6883:445-1749(-)
MQGLRHGLAQEVLKQGGVLQGLRLQGAEAEHELLVLLLDELLHRVELRLLLGLHGVLQRGLLLLDHLRQQRLKMAAELVVDLHGDLREPLREGILDDLAVDAGRSASGSAGSASGVVVAAALGLLALRRGALRRGLLAPLLLLVVPVVVVVVVVCRSSRGRRRLLGSLRRRRGGRERLLGRRLRLLREAVRDGLDELAAHHDRVDHHRGCRELLLADEVLQQLTRVAGGEGRRQQRLHVREALRAQRLQDRGEGLLHDLCPEEDRGQRHAIRGAAFLPLLEAHARSLRRGRRHVPVGAEEAVDAPGLGGRVGLRREGPALQLSLHGALVDAGLHRRRHQVRVQRVARGDLREGHGLGAAPERAAHARLYSRGVRPRVDGVLLDDLPGRADLPEHGVAHELGREVVAGREVRHGEAADLLQALLDLLRHPLHVLT